MTYFIPTETPKIDEDYIDDITKMISEQKPAFEFFGMKVFVVPNDAFNGIKDDKGNQCQWILTSQNNMR